MSLRKVLMEVVVDTCPKISLSEHALQRINQRTRLSPEAVLDRISNGGVYEAHRGNGVSYLVLWSGKDRRPFLAVVEKGIVVSFYYTYEFHRRKDHCIILPVHIELAKKALHSFLGTRTKEKIESSLLKPKSEPSLPKYRIFISWQVISSSGSKHWRSQRLCSCDQSTFQSFKGTLLEFILSQEGALECMQKIKIEKHCKAFTLVKCKRQIIASEDLT